MRHHSSSCIKLSIIQVRSQRIYNEKENSECFYETTHSQTYRLFSFIQSNPLIPGFPPDSIHQPSSFIGCVRDIRFFSDDTLTEVPIHSKGGLHSGCKNQCAVVRGEPAACHNDGRCINHYTHVSCDCFDTGYQGDYCEIQGKKKAHKSLTAEIYGCRIQSKESL